MKFRTILWILALAGCETSPAPKTMPSVQIHAEKADPSVLVPVVVDRAKLNKTFDVSVEHPGVDVQALRYYWYYDYSTNLASLDQAVVCSTALNRCELFPCSQLGAQNDQHHLTVVVSDLPLRVTSDQGHDPFDFPAGAHFDSVSWDIDLTGQCP